MFVISLFVVTSPSNKVLIANVCHSVRILMSAISAFVSKRTEDVVPTTSKETTNIASVHMNCKFFLVAKQFLKE